MQIPTFLSAIGCNGWESLYMDIHHDDSIVQSHGHMYITVGNPRLICHWPHFQG